MKPEIKTTCESANQSPVLRIDIEYLLFRTLNSLDQKNLKTFDKKVPAEKKSKTQQITKFLFHGCIEKLFPSDLGGICM
jgi:hypothetical protein